MKILLLHQNYPGQYRHFLNWLVSRREHEIVFLTQREQVPETDTHRIIRYKPHHKPADDAYALSKYFESCCGSALAVVEECWKLNEAGFKPDIAIGHCGWGEMMFIKDVWPDVPVVSYFEYYFTAHGGAVGYDPEFPASKYMPFIMRARNACHYISYDRCDAGQTATQWQKNIYPESFHPKIRVIHEGVRTEINKPDPNATIRLGRINRPITPNDEVFTYMARNMEPVRGFHIMMRALPDILEARPNARAVMIGGNDVSYGAELPNGETYRQRMEREVGRDIDWSRVHFVGQVPYDTYVRAIQVSRCHIYLTVPFVLSWSLLESMSTGKTIVASATAPVKEVIRDGQNGLLVDFLNPKELAKRVIDVLAHPDDYADIGKAARQTVLQKYDHHRVCLPKYINYLNRLLPKQKRLTM